MCAEGDIHFGWPEGQNVAWLHGYVFKQCIIRFINTKKPSEALIG